MANESADDASSSTGPVLAGLPMFNEEETIGTVVTMTLPYVDNVVCVDDGSSDDSAHVASIAGAIVHHHRVNRGYGGAMKTLFRLAREENAQALIILDSDGQHDPKDIPKLLEPIHQGNADIVIGSRFIGEVRSEEMPIYRKLGIKVISAASNLSSDLDVADTQSGFRAFGPRAIDRLRFDKEGMELSLEILDDAREKGLIVEEVSTVVRYDVPKGSRFTAISHGFVVLSYALMTLSQKKPLLVFGLPGLGFLTAAVALGMRTVSDIADFTPLQFTPGLTAVWIGVFGIALMFTGLVLQGARGLIHRLIVREFGIE